MSAAEPPPDAAEGADPPERTKGVRAVAEALACLLPLALVPLAAPHPEVVRGGLVLAVLLVPGALLAARLVPREHPCDRLVARLGLAGALALVPFGLATAVATLLHWRFGTFALVLAGVELLVSVPLLLALVRRGRPAGDAWPAPEPPARVAAGAGTASLVLLLAGLTALSRGAAAAGPAWSWWVVGGLVAGSLGAWLAARAARGPAEVEGEARWTARLLWLGVAALSWYLAVVAYERRYVNFDDATYVARSVDFLTGEPMDRFEPSLGGETPADPGFALATSSMLVSVVAAASGASCAAVQHTVLPPLVVAVGVGALVALLAVLVRGHRLRLPLATLVALSALILTMDSWRSVSNLLFYRALQPKSLHLLLVAPLQLGTLVALLVRPDRRGVALACLVALAGHLLHPWSTVAGLVWTGACGVAALFVARRSLGALAAVGAALVLLAGLHHLQGSTELLGPRPEAVGTPDWPIELAETEEGPEARLAAEETVGRYSLFRLGLLALPWIALLARRQRELWALVAAAGLVLGLAYVEPVAELAARVMPRSILWRTRWMLPSVANGALLACALAGLLAGLLRGRAALGALLAAALLGVALATSGSERVVRDGPVVRTSKLTLATHEIAEATGGLDASPYLLAPPPNPQGEAIATQICQLQPRVRLIASRKLILEWYFGVAERQRRLGLLAEFYGGTMDPQGFAALREEFPVDWAVIDLEREAAAYSMRLLKDAGWSRQGTYDRYELWRAP